jgi:hypothetical protein
MKRVSEKWGCPLCSENKNALYITRVFGKEKSKEQILCTKWHIVNEEVAYKRPTNCIKGTELSNAEKYLYKIICK